MSAQPKQFNAPPKQRLSTPAPMHQNYANNNQYNSQTQNIQPVAPQQNFSQNNVGQQNNQQNAQYLPPNNRRQEFWRQMVSNFLPQNQQQNQSPHMTRPHIDDEYQLAPVGFVPQGVPNKPLTSNKLSREQKLTFIEQGYIVVPNVVPKQFTDAALRYLHINYFYIFSSIKGIGKIHFFAEPILIARIQIVQC